MNDDGLNLNCTIHYNKWDKYVILFANNNAAVLLRLPFKNVVVAFVNYIVTDVQDTADKANVNLTGITEAKQLAKKAAADAFGEITSNAYAFAISINNTELKRVMKGSTASKLFNTKDENFVSVCNNLNELLTQTIADYPVAAITFFTAAQITAAMVLVGSFDIRLGKWRVANVNKNNAKIKFETDWMPKMEASLVFLESMLPGSITTGFPEFAKDFISLKKLDRTGVKDQGLLPSISDLRTGALFVNTARMETLNYTGTQNQKVMKTNDLGLFKLMKLKLGVWTVKFSAPGYEDQIAVYRITKRKVLKPEIKMAKIIP